MIPIYPILRRNLVVGWFRMGYGLDLGPFLSEGFLNPQGLLVVGILGAILFLFLASAEVVFHGWVCCCIERKYKKKHSIFKENPCGRD